MASMASAAASQPPATDTTAREKLRCTFCGKSQYDVRKLIAGPTAFICNECVSLCTRICENDDLPTEIGHPATRAAHLTDTLRRSGVLGDGRVCDTVVESSRDTILSRIIRLRLTYDGPAGKAPASVILKTGLSDRAGDGPQAGRQEVAFYNKVASVMSVQIVPRCFEAHWDPETKAWHLLLEDLTDSHAVPTQWPLPPTVEQSRRIVRALARFHAAWWDDSRLGITVGSWLDADAMDRRMRRLANEFERFTDRFGDLLPRERRALYEQLFGSASRLLTRYHSHRNVTIIHADTHVLNTFLPRDAGSDDVRFLDWDSWCIDIGSGDLAYMMALHWYPCHRQRVERVLLDHYHEALVAQGVRGYDRGALEDDYRWSVLWQITTPVWQALNHIPPGIWWNNLERIMLAVDDLNCRELLA
jgi:hypothetical protein